MPRWNVASVEKAAPDAASLAAARRLATPGPWSETGSTETLVWGKCQGSGRTPYQVSIDLSGPSYRCSCPSRKFPCKHALALLLRWVQGSGEITEVSAPVDEVQEWAARRDERRAATRAPVDPETRARRQAERREVMSAGLVDFDLWLGDLVRAGTAQARRQPWGWWDTAAARLVDAQLPGLAERLRAMGSEVSRRDDWADHLLTELGTWWSVSRAWSAWDALDERTRADVRAYLGWPVPTGEVRAGETVDDTWLVLGAHRTEDGRLHQQRTWLHGEATGHVVQLLDFAAGGAPLPLAHLAGSRLTATLGLYPGSAPRRALVVDDPEVSPDPGTPPAPVSLTTASAALVRAWADNPWTVRVPVVVRAALRPAAGREAASVVDADGLAVPLLDGDELWTALALTGGGLTSLVGELESGGFRLLSVLGDRGLVTA
ncbi:SWIM zinc finger family protein [Nocardioides flavescens]|uniref:SWIM zinc finger family protein n=1 Tax=Nocardioides flavescens TaxID=2691959 RepID=A0A6L7EQ18_9ACTN|nr:SWIM zinc finger family protein [Nocardioides flavescens]MXG89403.1 SWIM zinc finger family protein [Nocardioides flavescens]